MKPNKACKYCGQEDPSHYNYQCFKYPKRKSWQIKPVGSVYKQWHSFRRRWFLDHPADFYVCYLCGKKLQPYETTLDHVLPRSRRPDLRTDPTNIQPSCYECNMKKGSKVYGS